MQLNFYNEMSSFGQLHLNREVEYYEENMSQCCPFIEPQDTGYFWPNGMYLLYTFHSNQKMNILYPYNISSTHLHMQYVIIQPPIYIH